MSKIEQIRSLVYSGLYYLTEHADFEAMSDGFDIYDIEYALINGKIRRSWPRENKYEIVGKALDGSTIGVICRITMTGKIRIITVYEDKPKNQN